MAELAPPPPGAGTGGGSAGTFTAFSGNTGVAGSSAGSVSSAGSAGSGGGGGTLAEAGAGGECAGGAGSACGDQCPEDPDKTEPGVCGCGVPDVDTAQVAGCQGLKDALVHRYSFDGTGTVITDSVPKTSTGVKPLSRATPRSRSLRRRFPARLSSAVKS